MGVVEKKPRNQAASEEATREVKLKLLELKDQVKQLRQYDCFALEGSEGELIVLTNPIPRAPLEKLLGEYEKWLDGIDKSFLSRIWSKAPALIETVVMNVIRNERNRSVERPLINLFAFKHGLDVRCYERVELLKHLRLIMESLPDGQEQEDMRAVLSVLDKTPELVVRDREMMTQTRLSYMSETGSVTIPIGSGVIAYHPVKGCRMIEPYQRRKSRDKNYGEHVPGLPDAYWN